MSAWSRPARRACRWLARALTLVALSFSGRASADDLVAALWLHPGAPDDRLAQRVRGQISDLPVRLIEAQDAGLGATLGEQLDTADAIARKRGARVIVWFAPLDPASPRAGLLVVVAEADRGRVLIRRVASTAPSPSSGGSNEVDSATLEAAALIVRTALRGLAEGAVIGLDRTEIAPPPAPAKPAIPAPAPPKSRGGSTPAPRIFAPENRWIAAMGWNATFDGAALQHGLAGRVGAVRGSWSMGLSAASSLGADLVDPRATLRLARHAFGAFGELALVTTPQLSFGLGLTAGAVVFPRSTTAAATGIVPTHSTLNPHFFAGLAARGRWFPAAIGGFFGLWIDAGVDVVPGAPTFGYQVRGQFVPAHTLWPLQPGGAAGMIVMTP